jgi:hypothetical protein
MANTDGHKKITDGITNNSSIDDKIITDGIIYSFSVVDMLYSSIEIPIK